MREYLSSKDFIFYFILLLLSIEKSIFKFFLKKRLGSHAPIGPKVHLPLCVNHHYPNAKPSQFHPAAITL